MRCGVNPSKRAEELLERMRLCEFTRYPHELSGGQQQSSDCPRIGDGAACY